METPETAGDSVQAKSDRHLDSVDRIIAEIEMRFGDLRAALRQAMCPYCGHVESADDPEFLRNLRRHYETCKEHPIRVLEARAAVLYQDALATFRRRFPHLGDEEAEAEYMAYVDAMARKATGKRPIADCPPPLERSAFRFIRSHDGRRVALYRDGYKVCEGFYLSAQAVFPALKVRTLDPIDLPFGSLLFPEVYEPDIPHDL